MYLILSKDDIVFDSPKISLNVEESARFFLEVDNSDLMSDVRYIIFPFFFYIT